MKNSVGKSIVLLLLFFNVTANAEIFFRGDWSNYLDYFYDENGWKNLIPHPLGKKTGNGDWVDMNVFWKKTTPHTWGINESWDKDRISIELDPTSPKQSYVAKFVVKSGDHRPVHSGERAEMITMLDKNAKKLHVTKLSGHEFYGISVKVADDWIAPQKEEPKKGGNMWGIFMQLHSPNAFNSPPALDLSVDNSYALRMNAGEIVQFVQKTKTGEQKMTKKDCERFDLKNGNLRKGHWVQFVLDVNWSESTDGFVKLYRRDDDEKDFKLVLALNNLPTLQTSAYIPTDLEHCPSCAFDNIAHYWRVGFYRSTSENQTNTLWLGPVIRGDDINEVANAAFGKSGEFLQ